MRHQRQSHAVGQNDRRIKSLAAFGGSQTLNSGDIVRWPAPTSDHRVALSEVVDSGRYHRVNHPTVLALEKSFKQWVTRSSWRTVSSGTAAIHVALDYFSVKGGSVLTSALNWPGAVGPIYATGMTPRYADVSLHNACISGRSISAEDVSFDVVLNTHLFGNYSDAIYQDLRISNLPIVEDCAQALGAVPHICDDLKENTALVVSGNGSKHLGAGELGLIGACNQAILANVENVSLASSSRNNGRTFSPMSQGYNYRPNPFSAAIALDRMRNISAQIAQRRDNVSYLWRSLSSLPGLKTAFDMRDETNSFCVMPLRIEPSEIGLPSSSSTRDKIVRLLVAEGVPASVWLRKPVWEYLPYHDESFDVAEFPNTMTLLDTMFHVSEIAPPNSLSLMEKYALAFEKVWEAIPVLNQYFEHSTK